MFGYGCFRFISSNFATADVHNWIFADNSLQYNNGLESSTASSWEPALDFHENYMTPRLSPPFIRAGMVFQQLHIAKQWLQTEPLVVGSRASAYLIHMEAFLFCFYSVLRVWELAGSSPHKYDNESVHNRTHNKNQMLSNKSYHHSLIGDVISEHPAGWVLHQLIIHICLFARTLANLCPALI